MLVTSWCLRFKVGDDFWMLVTEFCIWWLQCLCRHHRNLSQTSVTNIDVIVRPWCWSGHLLNWAVNEVRIFEIKVRILAYHMLYIFQLQSRQKSDQGKHWLTSNYWWPLKLCSWPKNISLFTGQQNQKQVWPSIKWFILVIKSESKNRLPVKINISNGP